MMLAVVAVAFCVGLVVMSRVEERAAQNHAFARLRQQLAKGVAPTGQLDANGTLLAFGTPVAWLQIPKLHLSEVVLEGTTSSVLMSGPGHLRSTFLPGQNGSSVIFGRGSAYGGPFGGLSRLKRGDVITATTGVGKSTYKVVDLRRAGDPVPPPPAADSSRLVLVTATGLPFVPTGVLRVDADIIGPATPTPDLAVTSVDASETPMHGQTNDLWAMVFLMQALLALSIGAVYAWRAWGRAQTWMVFTPAFLLLGFYLQNQVVRILPNLL